MAISTSPPKVKLDRAQWLRLIVVGAFVAFVAARVAPEVVRAFVPLHLFGYVTDGDGVVVARRAEVPKGSQRIAAGDRVRLDRIKPFDRKPGLAGEAYSRDDPDRHLPVQRGRRLLTLHLLAHDESVQNRVTTVLRVVLFLGAVGASALLFLVRPTIATAAILFYVLGGDVPTTFSEVVLDNPWRQPPQWLHDTLAGMGRPALLLFALALVVTRPVTRRLLAAGLAVFAFALGSFHAYAEWRLTYGAQPAQGFDDVYTHVSSALTALTTVVFLVAFVRARGIDRQRVGLLAAAFAVAGIARLASDALFPGKVALWENGLLLAVTVVPIAAVWFAVVRHNFFEVDFVVSRAVVYVALSAAFIGAVGAAEEIGTYLFANNTDYTYGIIFVVSSVLGMFTGKIREFIEHFVDRFIFRGRLQQRRALEFIAGYILDAETEDDVYRALLEDAPHALNLAFGGVLRRRDDGSFTLEQSHQWPEDCVVRIDGSDDLARVIQRSRGALAFAGKDTRLIRRAFPHERLTFAAPLIVDRTVGAIVVYGHNVTGLDLDPDEREHLVRVVAHASLALTTIELARYRKLYAQEREAAPIL